MRKLASLVSCVAVAVACSGVHHTVEVVLENASFGTTGGNLFNCSTPDKPSNAHAVDKGPIFCEPEVAADGSFTTTPVVAIAQTSCGDGHSAIVTVTCAGTGSGHDVSVTVAVSIGATCDTKAGEGTDPQAYSFQDVAPGQTLVSPTLASCAVFDNLCSTTNACAFNAFHADISVSNSAR